MSTYDAKKAKKLFDQHIRPVVTGGGFGPVQWLEVPAPRGAVGAYVITPEALRALGWLADHYNYSDKKHAGFAPVTQAIYDFIHGEQGCTAPFPDWAEHLSRKPAWRVEVEKEWRGYDDVLDAVEHALEAK